MIGFADTHNFGRQVRVESSYVYKPRSSIGEYLLLDDTSPLRQFLRIHFDPKFLTTLLSLRLRSRLEVQPTLNEVRIDKAPPSGSITNLNASDFVQLGHTIGLLHWLGYGDLHRDNLYFSKLEDQVIFTALDAELYFLEQSLPQMSPHALHCSCYGLYPLVRVACREARDGCALNLVAGVVEFFSAAKKAESYFHESIGTLMREWNPPVRVLLRNTRDYHAAHTTTATNVNQGRVPFIDEETLQLERCDVPFFFRKLFDETVYFWSSNEKTTAISSSLEGLLEPPASLFASPPRTDEQLDRLRDQVIGSVTTLFEPRPGEDYIWSTPERATLKIAFRGETVLVLDPLLSLRQKRLPPHEHPFGSLRYTCGRHIETYGA